jgi:hypothetical protein
MDRCGVQEGAGGASVHLSGNDESLIHSTWKYHMHAHGRLNGYVLYVYIYIFLYVHVYIYVYICIYIFVNVYMYIYIDINITGSAGIGC